MSSGWTRRRTQSHQIRTTLHRNDPRQGQSTPTPTTSSPHHTYPANAYEPDSPPSPAYIHTLRSPTHYFVPMPLQAYRTQWRLYMHVSRPQPARHPVPSDKRIFTSVAKQMLKPAVVAAAASYVLNSSPITSTSPSTASRISSKPSPPLFAGEN
jgi:hypothetical protein